MRSSWLSGLLAPALLVAASAAAQNIGPDVSFGTGGKVYTSFSSVSGYCSAVAVQPDQKIVAVGTYGGSQDFLVTRYLPSGQLDASFGVSGTQVFNFGFSYEECFAVAVQPTDSKLILGGQANGDYALLRLLPNGQPDPAFDTDGRVQLSFGPGNGSNVRQILVQPDGKIVAAGFAYSGTDFDFAVARFLPNGSPDATFGTGGKTLIPIGAGRDQGRAALIQPDGKIVVVGDSYDNSGNPRFGICRLTAAGVLDATFGTGGKRFDVLSPANSSVPWGVAIQPNGRLVVAGEAVGDFAVARYTAAGALDASFGNGGYRISDLNGSQDKAYALVLQPNGNILLGGNSFTSRPGSLGDFALARYTTAGALDTSFGTNGALVVPMGAYNSVVAGMALQADGKPVCAGVSVAQQGGVVEFGILRLTSVANGLAPETDIHAQAAFPNPLEAGSVLTYTLDRPGTVGATAYDALGRPIADLQPATWQAAGEHTLGLASLALQPAGLYTIRLTTATGTTVWRVAR